MLSFLDNETFAREVEKFRHCLKIVDKTTEVLKGASIDFQNLTFTVDATAVAPYRYLELLFSSTAAYLVFGELPEKSTIYGGLILIPSVLFIAYSESKLINKKLNDHQNLNKIRSIL